VYLKVICNEEITIKISLTLFAAEVKFHLETVVSALLVNIHARADCIMNEAFFLAAYQGVIGSCAAHKDTSSF
jgi:hypothetical protein